jgi:sugar O-acyltransferase (sialic acid O-acetyltransferase NeuD family)
VTTAGPIGLYGSGGCARGIMPLARLQYPDRALVFVEDDPQRAQCNGHAVLEFDQFARQEGASIAIAVADPQCRRALAAKCHNSGLRFIGVAAQDMIVMDDAIWGEGCLFSPRVTLTSNIRIGNHFHCNLHSIVEHDCRIGDYVTFAPGVRCNGAVTIGDGAYIGAGAIIRQGVTIGECAVVGMGAVVVKDVPPGLTVAGNPARRLRRSESSA